MRDPYSMLGVHPGASDDEVKNAYRNLARKYHPDNYDDSNPLKELAKEKMQEINAAYDEIQRNRSDRSSSSSSSYSSGSSYSNSSSYGGNSSYNYSYTRPPIYIEIRQKINERRYRDAENLLNSVNEFDRVAEWHFLNSVCLNQRGRVADAIRELEMACNMDPANLEYQRAKEMFNTSGSSYGSAYYGSDRQYRRSSADQACDCCTNLICLDCLCECMGGDLIPCC